MLMPWDEIVGLTVTPTAEEMLPGAHLSAVAAELERRSVLCRLGAVENPAQGQGLAPAAQRLHEAAESIGFAVRDFLAAQHGVPAPVKGAPLSVEEFFAGSGLVLDFLKVKESGFTARQFNEQTQSMEEVFTPEAKAFFFDWIVGPLVFRVISQAR